MKTLIFKTLQREYQSFLDNGQIEKAQEHKELILLDAQIHGTEDLPMEIQLLIDDLKD